MKSCWIESLCFNPDWHVVAFIGGGGKTTAIEALAMELANLGKSVLITTTTKIMHPQTCCNKVVLRETIGVSQDYHALLNKQCQKGSVVVSGESLSPDNKIIGHTLEQLHAIVEACCFDVVLVEADGSKGKSLKAHEVHEPQLPVKTDFCYVMMGADVFGKTLNDNWVHRASLFSTLTCTPLGHVITPELVSTFYNVPRGYGAQLPVDLPSAVVITKVSSLSRYRQVIRLKQAMPDKTVLIAPLKFSEGKRSEVSASGKLRAVLLAAGRSTRFGRSKPLQMLFGKTFVEWVVGMLLATAIGEIVVVYKDVAVTEKLVESFSEAVACKKLMFVHNEKADEGQSTSVRAGLLMEQEPSREFIAGYMFVMADQLLLDEESVDRLIQAFKPTSIVVPHASGQVGAPVLFAAEYLEELKLVTGDQGGRSVIKRHPEQLIQVSVSPTAMMDVDTQEDLQGIIKMME